MNNKALSTIEKYNMISSGDKVLVAVSGGADSMALLDLLVKFKNKLGITLAVAHIEHGIRGEDSVKDAEFVEEYCKKNDVEFHKKSINAPLEAKINSMSVEEYSRKARYDFFNTIKCDKIATAHNQTDNIETLIFRLARGTGIKGACAIPPVRGKIIRPFIEISSSEIREYCKNNAIDYRTDSTNSDDSYSRNLIRNEILPLFFEINSEWENNISSFIGDINESSNLINVLTLQAYDNAVSDNVIDCVKLNEFKDLIKKLVLKKYFESNNIYVDRKHLTAALKLTEKSGKIQLKGSLFAVSQKGKLHIADFSNKNNNINKTVCKILNISEFKPQNIDFYCDCDKIIGSAVIRSRKDGDSVRPQGRGCSKTIKKLFNEIGLALEQRNQKIIVADDCGVIGVIGYCVDERVCVDGNTKRVFTIKLPSED